MERSDEGKSQGGEENGGKDENGDGDGLGLGALSHVATLVVFPLVAIQPLPAVS